MEKQKNNKKTIFALNKNLMIFISILLFLIISTLILNQSDFLLRKDILERTIIAASSLDKEKLNELEGLPSDLNLNSYFTTKKQLIRLKFSIPNCKYIYLLGKNSENDIIFLANGAPMDEMYETTNQPGDTYVEANSSYRVAMDSETAKVIGPMKDQYGKIVSSMVPITLSDNRIILFCIDISANNWILNIIEMSISLILLVLLIIVLYIIFFVLNKKNLLIVDAKNEALINSQKILSSTIWSIGEGLIITDMNGGIIKINKQGENILERTFSEIKNFHLNNVFILQFEKNEKNQDNLFQTILKNEDDNYKLNEVILFGKNKYTYISLSASKIISNNKIIGTVLIFRDISENVIFNKKLKNNEHKLKTIIEKSPIVVINTDTAGIITFIDGFLLQSMGIKKSELHGENINSIFNKDSKFIDGFLSATLGKEKSIIVPFNEYFFNVSISPIIINNDYIDGILIVGFDVTESQNNQKSLRESEETFRALTENSYDTIMRFNRSKEYIYVNKMIEKNTGISRYKFFGKKHIELGFPRFLCELWDNAIEKVFESSDINRIEFPMPNGIWLDWLLMPEFDINGNVKAVIVSARNISDKKRIENQLEYFQQYLSEIINSMPSIIMGVNSNGKINLWNVEIAKTTGKSADEVINGDATPFLNMFGLEFNILQDSILKNEKIEIPKQKVELNGSVYYKNIVIYPLNVIGSSGVVLRIDDITKQVRLETDLVQSEKMVSLGGLALGMAHEINNPIAGMIHNIEVITNRLTKELPANISAARKYNINLDDLKKYIIERKITKSLSLMYNSGQRAAEITINILNFSKKGNIQKSKCRLSNIVNDSIDILCKDDRYCEIYKLKNLKINKAEIGFLDTVFCNKGQIIQVIINIIKNGLESILETDRKGKMSVNLTSKEGYLFLSIADNGIAISEEEKRFIYDPFYTTKSPKNGVGLGLAVSYYIIVHNHGGDLYLRNQKENHKEFIIKLPTIEDN